MGRSLLLDKNTGHYRQPESLGKQAEGVTNRGKTSTFLTVLLRKL